MRLFRRHKLLLATLEAFGGDVPPTDFMKLMFLLREKFGRREYDFTPYKYGPFSWTLYRDKEALVKFGALGESERFTLTRSAERRIDEIGEAERSAVEALRRDVGDARGKTLVRRVYLDYPYYATRSEIAHEYLDRNETRRIEAARRDEGFRGLATVGYEGRSIDELVRLLLRKGVRCVIDVRKNPLSRKYGFSKRSLSSILEKFDVAYVHLPNLGIPSEARGELSDLASYKELFARYERDVLPNATADLRRASEIVRRQGSATLLCYERDPDFCHRKRVADRLERLGFIDDAATHF